MSARVVYRTGTSNPAVLIPISPEVLAPRAAVTQRELAPRLQASEVPHRRLHISTRFPINSCTVSKWSVR